MKTAFLQMSCPVPLFQSFSKNPQGQNLVVIPHLTERLSLLYQSNQKSFRAVGQTTCQHTRQEVVGKVIVDMPSDFHCHHEDKKKWLVSHATKTTVIENAWKRTKHLSRNRCF